MGIASSALLQEKMKVLHLFFVSFIGLISSIQAKPGKFYLIETRPAHHTLHHPMRPDPRNEHHYAAKGKGYAENGEYPAENVHDNAENGEYPAENVHDHAENEEDQAENGGYHAENGEDHAENGEDH